MPGPATGGLACDSLISNTQFINVRSYFLILCSDSFSSARNNHYQRGIVFLSHLSLGLSRDCHFLREVWHRRVFPH